LSGGRPAAGRALPRAVLAATEDRRTCRMITLYGEGRGFRVAWLLEELGVPYRLRPVDLLNGLEDDAEFLAVNPAGFIPAIVDGEVTMVESIAIMEYLLARYGAGQLAPDADDP